MSLFRITGKSIRKPYISFLYGCKTIGRHCGKSGWERFDFWGYTFTIISLWRKMSRSLIRLCKQYIIRVIFNATDIWVHSIIDLRVFTAILYQKLLLLFVACTQFGALLVKKLVLVQSRDVKHNCYCSSDTNISDLNYDFVVTKWNIQNTYILFNFFLFEFKENNKRKATPTMGFRRCFKSSRD